MHKISWKNQRKQFATIIDCGIDGGAVASDTRGPRFESNHVNFY